MGKNYDLSDMLDKLPKHLEPGDLLRNFQTGKIIRLELPYTEQMIKECVYLWKLKDCDLSKEGPAPPLIFDDRGQAEWCLLGPSILEKENIMGEDYRETATATEVTQQPITAFRAGHLVKRCCANCQSFVFKTGKCQSVPITTERVVIKNPEAELCDMGFTFNPLALRKAEKVYKDMIKDMEDMVVLGADDFEPDAVSDADGPCSAKKWTN